MGSAGRRKKNGMTVVPKMKKPEVLVAPPAPSPQAKSMFSGWRPGSEGRPMLPSLRRFYADDGDAKTVRARRGLGNDGGPSARVRASSRVVHGDPALLRSVGVQVG